MIIPNIAIFDLFEAFDTVTQDKCLQKLDNDGVRGNILKWLTRFLKNWKMNVVVKVNPPTIRSPSGHRPRPLDVSMSH